MAHLKTLMKAITSQDRVDSNLEEEVSYLNNQGGGDFEAIAKEIKVRIIMIRLVIRIGIKETRRAKMVGVEYL